MRIDKRRTAQQVLGSRSIKHLWEQSCALLNHTGFNNFRASNGLVCLLSLNSERVSFLTTTVIVLLSVYPCSTLETNCQMDSEITSTTHYLELQSMPPKLTEKVSPLPYDLITDFERIRPEPCQRDTLALLTNKVQGSLSALQPAILVTYDPTRLWVLQGFP